MSVLQSGVLLEHSAATAALQPGGGRPGYGRAARKWQPPGPQKNHNWTCSEISARSDAGRLRRWKRRGDYFGANTMTI
jgi:hypothetical protein